jgi:protein-tyrosine-phosphatase
VSVELRARLHAALADPTRLRIVDLLALGDASPSQLGADLGVSSNLLAHHLNVLQDVGLVTRVRSAGDHRRSYVQLVPDALDGLGPPRPPTPCRVVFVCTANTARSQLAAALWRHVSTLPVASAGTRPGRRVAPEAIAAAHRHGLPLRAARPRLVDDVLTDGDLVVTVCDRACEELGSRAALHWSVPDPVPIGTPDAFDRAVAQLAPRVARLATGVASG